MIQIKNIVKTFGNKIILNGVSFYAANGEVYGLIGKNGAGKTTLMTIAAGLLAAEKGEIDTEGGNAGYLPDVPEYFDYLNCGEYIDFLLKGKNTQRKKELLNGVMLEEKTRIGKMSRGMRQRLGIAAVLVNDPGIILFDEPTSALDPKGRSEFKEILNRLKQKGKSIILSTHILNDMENVCDRVGFLSGGVIKKEVNISELTQNTAVRVCFAKDYVPPENIMPFKINVIDKRNIVFEFEKNNMEESQRELFKHFAQTGNIIVTINNEIRNLDELFKEVCGE